MKTYQNGLEDAAEMLRAKANVFRKEAPTIGPGRIEKAEILEEIAAVIVAAGSDEKAKLDFLADMQAQADAISPPAPISDRDYIAVADTDEEYREYRD